MTERELVKARIAQLRAEIVVRRAELARLLAATGEAEERVETVPVVWPKALA